jgi:hypothetical protein
LISPAVSPSQVSRWRRAKVAWCGAIWVIKVG